MSGLSTWEASYQKIPWTETPRCAAVVLLLYLNKNHQIIQNIQNNTRTGWCWHFFLRTCSTESNKTRLIHESTQHGDATCLETWGKKWFLCANNTYQAIKTKKEPPLVLLWKDFLILANGQRQSRKPALPLSIQPRKINGLTTISPWISKKQKTNS